MGLSEFFSWAGGGSNAKELPELFPLPVPQSEFILTDVVTIFAKILTDTLERIHGLSEEQIPLLWDNCEKSSKSDGLITLLAKAMANKAELYVVFDKDVNVIREATSEEKSAIAADYKKQAESKVGVYITFSNYRKSDMVKLYSALEYSTISALNKSMNVSASVQLKFSKLRESVALTDSSVAIGQAEGIARALLNARPIMIDADDEIATAVPDLTATEKSMDFIACKQAFYLGLPSSYITGEQTGGIGSTGEADTKAVERGLKGYYFSIMKPVLEAIFDVSLEYKSQDTTNLSTGLDALKAFSVTDDQLISKENKTLILNKIFDLPEDSEGDPAPKPVNPPPAAGPVPPPAKPGVPPNET